MSCSPDSALPENAVGLLRPAILDCLSTELGNSSRWLGPSTPSLAPVHPDGSSSMPRSDSALARSHHESVGPESTRPRPLPDLPAYSAHIKPRATLHDPTRAGRPACSCSLLPLPTLRPSWPYPHL